MLPAIDKQTINSTSRESGDSADPDMNNSPRDECVVVILRGMAYKFREGKIRNLHEDPNHEDGKKSSGFSSG
jgi:hypothetical protein